MRGIEVIAVSLASVDKQKFFRMASRGQQSYRDQGQDGMGPKPTPTFQQMGRFYPEDKIAT